MRNTRFTVFILAALIAGCTRDPQVLRQRYIASGDGYLKNGKTAEAVIQFANAVNQDPKSGEARFKLADAYMAAGNTKAAFPEYIRAADLLPNDMEAQLRAGHMLFKGGLFTEARARARIVLQKQPDNVTALILMGNTLAGLKNLQDAVSVLERAIRVDPERAGSYANLGILRLAEGNTAEAEQTFVKAVDVSHRSTASLLALANFYRAVDRDEDAERILLEARASNPRDMPVNEALAGLMMSTGRDAQAEPYLKSVAGIAGTPEAEYALAAYYLSASRFDDALKTLEPLLKVTKERNKATERIAMTYFVMGKRDRALTTIESGLAKDSRYVPALTLKARLLLAGRDPDAAEPVVSMALQLDPKSVDAHVTKGRILLALRKIDEAKSEFQQTIKLDPASLPALLELAQLNLDRQQIDSALTFADQAVTSHPESLSARVMLVRALLIRDDDWPRADKEMAILLQRFPNAAATYDVQGALRLARSDRSGAVQAFERARTLAPADVQALAGLVAIDLAARKVDSARDRVEVALAVKRDVATLVLAATVFDAAHDTRRVESTLKEILQADPDNPESYARLAQFYVSESRLVDARQEFERVAARDPKSVAAPTMLGLLAYMNRDRVEAARMWQTALRLDPQAAAAANNLAWLMAEDGKDLETALRLAQVAKARYSDVAEVNDTLGWVYYRKGLNSLAATYLQQSIDKDPSNPIYHYHLGMAYAKAGEDGKARRALQHAITLNPKFDGVADAKKALAGLVY